MFPTTLDVLPDDVLYDVLYHSSVRDILSLRQVSRKFYHLTYHRSIWVDVYTRCPILLPPGPFSHQSPSDLERALKKAHLLEANWTSPSPCPVSRQTIVVPSITLSGNHMKLVGRYLLVAGPPMFRCYDLESKNGEFAAIATYDSTDIVFDCVVEKYSAVDSNNCQLLCALRNRRGVGITLVAVTLLKLHISQGSAKFEFLKEVRVSRRSFHEINIIGDFVAMGIWYDGPILLHIPTCQIHHVPPRDFFNDVERENVGMRNEYTVTSNHLLCYSHFGYKNIIEVFPLPCGAAQPNDDDEIPVHILTRSHKLVHSDGVCCAILLTERHERHRSNDRSTHYTLIAIGRPAAEEACRLGFFDIFLGPDLVSTTWTDAAQFGDEGSHGEAMLLAGSACAGIARLVVLKNSEEYVAFTISEDGDGKRVVRGKPLVAKLGYLEMWDGLDVVRGRVCHLVGTAQVEVLSFV